MIGPNVTLEAGTKVVNSKLAHTIVGEKGLITDTELHHSMLGDRVTVQRYRGVATLGDDSEVIAG